MGDGDLEVRIDDDAGTITVVGAVDDAERFSRALMGRVTVPATTTVVDLSGVTFFPSSAMTVLVRARKAAQQAASSMDVTSEAGSIASRVLQISGFPLSTTGASR